MKVCIIEFDKDYHTVTGSEVKEFASIEEAQTYCHEESWSGYSYFIDHEATKYYNRYLNENK